jgi:hypothetical protein
VFVGLSNIFLFSFLVHAKVPKQKIDRSDEKIDEEIDRILLMAENEETDLKADDHNYTWIVDTLKATCIDMLKGLYFLLFLIIAVIYLINTFMGITILLKICFKYVSRIFA